MISEQKLRLLEAQKRSYRTATVKNFQKKPVLIDDEDGEFIFPDEVIDQKLEIFKNAYWVDFSALGYRLEEVPLNLQAGDKIRFPKALPYSFECFIEELGDDSFFIFVQQLNVFGFSVYDIVFGHNQLLYRQQNKPIKGASVFIFDHTTSICTVQHLFERGKIDQDRFEFLLSTGERCVASSVS